MQFRVSFSVKGRVRVKKIRTAFATKDRYIVLEVFDEKGFPKDVRLNEGDSLDLHFEQEVKND